MTAIAHANDHSLVVLILELQGESFAIETSQVREILVWCRSPRWPAQTPPSTA